MTQKRELIEKARKIAARMRSPYPNEVEVASEMLRKLLAEHNLSMKDLGLDTSDVTVSRTAAPSKDTRRFVHDEFEDIVDTNYKRVYTYLDRWEKHLICQLSSTLCIEVSIYDQYTKFVGLSSDVKLMKKFLVYLTHFIEDLLRTKKLGYLDSSRNEFAIGFITSVLGVIGLRATHTPEKARIIKKYMDQRYHAVTLSYGTSIRKCENLDAYHAGISAGRNFRMPSQGRSQSESIEITVKNPHVPRK